MKKGRKGKWELDAVVGGGAEGVIMRLRRVLNEKKCLRGGCCQVKSFSHSLISCQFLFLLKLN